MTEAVHVAAAIRGGASLVHGVQMREHATKRRDVDAASILSLAASTALRSLAAPAAPAARCWAGCRSRASSTRRCSRPGSSPLTARARIDDASDQRRQALQPDVPPLPRRRRPDRREVDDARDDGACLAALEASDIPTVDITGGAPELNPHFRWLVDEVARARPARDRPLQPDGPRRPPGRRDLPEFLARHEVEVVALAAALPRAEHRRPARRGRVREVDRGAAAAERRRATATARSGLRLVLVTNPVGAFLPPAQASLEAEWKRELLRLHGVHVRRALLHHEHADQPLPRVARSSPETSRATWSGWSTRSTRRPCGGVMCRNTLSVGWDGRLYDCDFNQMLDLAVAGRAAAHPRLRSRRRWQRRPIVDGPALLRLHRRRGLELRRQYKIGRMPQPLCVVLPAPPGGPAWRPFCSERCKLQDLARWADGTYQSRRRTAELDDRTRR